MCRHWETLLLLVLLLLLLILILVLRIPVAGAHSAALKRRLFHTIRLRSSLVCRSLLMLPVLLAVVAVTVTWTGCVTGSHDVTRRISCCRGLSDALKMSICSKGFVRV